MAGRPTKYEPKMNKLAEKLCILGATDKEMADALGIDEATLNRWKLKYPAFCASIKRGKILADIKVADSLFKRATGYSHRAVKIFNHEGKPLIIPYIEKFAPDITAAIFWLKNRRGKINPDDGQAWKDRQEMGLQLGDLTDQQLQDMVDRLAAKVVQNNKPQNEQDGK
jgi:hypothetical protein